MTILIQNRHSSLNHNRKNSKKINQVQVDLLHQDKLRIKLTNKIKTKSKSNLSSQTLLRIVVIINRNQAKIQTSMKINIKAKKEN